MQPEKRFLRLKKKREYTINISDDKLAQMFYFTFFSTIGFDLEALFIWGFFCRFHMKGNGLISFLVPLKNLIYKLI